MSFKQAISAIWRDYAKFSGRSRRAEYWYFILFQFIIYLCLIILAGIFYAVATKFGQDSIAATFYTLAGISGAAIFVFLCGCIVPILSVGWRRFQDQDIPGWWAIIFLVLSLVPYINIISCIIHIIFMARRGTKGANQYGSDPLAPGGGSSDDAQSAEENSNIAPK